MAVVGAGAYSSDLGPMENQPGRYVKPANLELLHYAVLLSIADMCHMLAEAA
ncbi:MAG: hypothetical protein AAF959_00255 [Cyanobacteria bacterium P01_D01_bin.56]